MKQRHPGHYLWKHKLFSPKLFLDFEARLLQAIETREDPVEMQLQQAMPKLMNYLKSTNEALFQEIKLADTESRAGLMALKIQMIKIGNSLEDWFAGRRPMMLAPVPFPLMPASTAHFTGATGSQDPIFAASAINNQPAVSIEVEMSSISLTAPAALPPPFVMDRSLSTVYDHWREYNEGIGGGPAVRVLY